MMFLKRKEHSFNQLQCAYFKDVERERFWWQTKNPYIVSKEKELLIPLLKLELNGPILEVGCGEGANLVNLRSMGFKQFYYGIDFCFEKVKFAFSQRNANAGFICGDVARLPFKDERFEALLLRDILHHVGSNKKAALEEVIRVCQKSGYIFIIEGNGAKLTNRIFQIITPHEKGMRDSTPKKLEDLFKGLQINNVHIFMKEPFNLFRFFLHYRYGVGFLGNIRYIRFLLNLAEKIAVKIMHRDKWAYIIAVIRK